MNTTTLKSPESIFNEGNKHLETKSKYFGLKGLEVIKFVLSKQRLFKGQFFMSNKHIAESIGCSVRTVQLALKKAVQFGIFIISERVETTSNGKHRQTTNLIELLPYEDFEMIEEVKEVIVTKVREVKTKIKTIKHEVKSNIKTKQCKTVKRKFLPVELLENSTNHWKQVEEKQRLESKSIDLDDVIKKWQRLIGRTNMECS